ncbi:hypothetical protein [Nonomuraea pusilla]|uniref:Uncharacterized protein n=1 Tax=Nonomuraea pusilla TaxID=46177 RepID=A0A1H8K797_9ACTN|nr:hypothetical protein [Nonomuraea pusilla]SEN88356.1 hypothetical protein SAMN05660976_08533 [Nonomuraea pusilla]
MSEPLCESLSTISGISLTCDRSRGHDGLHRDADKDLTWPPAAADQTEEG